MICSGAAYGLVALFHYLQNRYSLDTDRWSGLIADAYNFAEQQGLLKSLDSSGKLEAALTRFEQQFVKVYAGQPTTTDITDAVLDLAKLALVSKFGQPAAATTVTTIAASATPPAAPAVSATK